MTRTRSLRVSTGETEDQKAFIVSTSAPTPLKRSALQVSTLGAWCVPRAQHEDVHSATRTPTNLTLYHIRCKDELDMAITKVCLLFVELLRLFEKTISVEIRRKLG